MEYSVYWEIPKEPDFLAAATFIDPIGYDEVLDDPNWPNGYRVKEFDLDAPEFDVIDGLADQAVCINLKPSPRPNWSPTGR